MGPVGGQLTVPVVVLVVLVVVVVPGSFIIVVMVPGPSLSMRLIYGERHLYVRSTFHINPRPYPNILECRMRLDAYQSCGEKMQGH